MWSRYRASEIESGKEFLSFALDPETNVIYYEDYVSRLIMENEKHMEMLAKGYEKFKYP